MKCHKISDLTLGMSASREFIANDSDIIRFSEVSGDKNPIHLDEEYARKSPFKKRIAHGMMSASFFSGIFGTELPGVGCLYVSQTLKFKKPVFVGEKVTAKVVVIKICSRTNKVTFDTYCSVNNIKVITGQAEIFIPN